MWKGLALAVGLAGVAGAVVTAGTAERPLTLPPAARGLVGVVDVGRHDAVVRLDPRDLRVLSRPLALPGIASHAALSPDGATLAIGDRNANRVTLLDLPRWRVTRTLRVPATDRSRYPGVVALSWPRPHRLLALGGAPGWRNTLSLLDPRGKLVPRTELWRGATAHVDATRHGMVLLGVPALRRAIAPAQVLFADADGDLRSVRLGRIPAGARWNGRVERFTYPALAATGSGTRVVVVGERLAAEVGRDGDVTYHPLRPRRSPIAWLRDVFEPPAQAGGVPMAGTWREARQLADGTLAVSGYEALASAPGEPFRQRALGVTLVDPRDWRTARAAPRATMVRDAGSLALGVTTTPKGRGVPALTAVDADGRSRFERFPGASATVLAANGRRAYVVVRRGHGPATLVVDLRDGHTLDVARGGAIRQIIPIAVRRSTGPCSYLGGERSCPP